jgi:Fe-S oxidoreductase
MYLAFLEADKGNNDTTVLRELIAIAEAHGYLWDVLDGRHLLGTLAFRRGDTDTARTELGIVQALARDNHNQLLEHSASEMLEQLDREANSTR